MDRLLSILSKSLLILITITASNSWKELVIRSCAITCGGGLSSNITPSLPELGLPFIETFTRPFTYLDYLGLA